MSSGMNMKEAEKIADKMSYREAVMNCLYARCVPYRKATKIKMKRLLECIEAFNLDLDLYTPMHFTPEQKAWIKKYIAINGERQRADTIDEFETRILGNCSLTLKDGEKVIVIRQDIFQFISEQMQKGAEEYENI